MKIEVSGGMGRLGDFFRTMHRQFSEAEWRYIRVPPSDASKLGRFIRLWSLKESLVKAEGSGIVLPLSQVSFKCPTELISPEQKLTFDSSATMCGRLLTEWLFEESMLDRGHYVSVAKKKVVATDEAEANHQTPSLHFQMLSIEELLAEASTCISGNLFTFDDEKYWTDFCRKT